MGNKIDEILELTKEVSAQDSNELDLTVTRFGEELTNTGDLEFLWTARSTTSVVKNTSSNIKTFSDVKMAKNIEGNGAVRLGDEVFVFKKSYTWKVHDLKNLIKWLIKPFKLMNVWSLLLVVQFPSILKLLEQYLLTLHLLLILFLCL